jgi:sugar/nucleoside kinase (ribokinase family)
MLPSQAQANRFDLTLAGETNLDLIFYGLPEAMPLERELLASGFKLTLGGSSSILAHNLAVLGSRVGFITQTGDDELGRIALDLLRDSNVDLSRSTVRHDVGTGVTALFPHSGPRHIITYPGVMASTTLADLDLAYLASSRHFHLSSLWLQTGLQPDLPRLFTLLRAQGVTVSLDTNDDPSGHWAGVLDDLLDCIDILLPNEEEVKRITARQSVDQALDVLAPRVPLTVVKCGSRGAVVQQGAVRDWVAPIAVEPIDTIGAGDSFNAGFLHSYLQGVSAVRSATLGNITGALSTQGIGGTSAFRDQTLRQRFLAQHAVG